MIKTPTDSFPSSILVVKVHTGSGPDSHEFYNRRLTSFDGEGSLGKDWPFDSVGGRESIGVEVIICT